MSAKSATAALDDGSYTWRPSTGDLEPKLQQFTVDARAPHKGFSLLIR